MKLLEIFRYELGYRFRSASTWTYAGVLFLVAIWIFLATDDAVGAAHFNAPERLAGGAIIAGTFGILVTAALFGHAAVRDVDAGMDALLFTCPLRKLEYLGGRFLAALAVNAAVALAIPLGLLAVTGLMAHFEPEAVGPFRAGAYLQPFFFLLLPNLVFVGAILFTVGTLARQTIPVYLGAIGFFVLYVIARNYAEELESPMLSALGDPLGLGALEATTRYWPVAERNTRLVGLPATLFANRVLWLSVGAAVLALLYARFRFAVADGGGRRRRGRRLVAAPLAEWARPVDVPRVAGSFGFRTTARQTLAVTRRSLAEVAGSRWFIAVLFACAGLSLLFGWDVGESVFDTSTWPVTLLVAGTVLSERIVPIVSVLIALYAGELVWKDRQAGEAEIADSAPVPEGAALVGRFLALVAMLAMIQAALLFGGVVTQALQGYGRFELGLYVRILFGLKLADYVLIAALAMTIHAVVNQKYVGHIVVLLAAAAPFLLQGLGVVRHHLLLYGTDPGWTYSDMNGFGPFVGPFVWFKLYWAAWALLLAVVAALFWVRGREPGLRSRLRQARTRFAGPVARTAVVAIALIVGFGGFIFFNTNVLNAYRTTRERGAPQAEYEKRYGRQADVAQPTIAGVELRVEIFPHEPAVDLSGRYRLVNRTGGAIDSVHVSLDPRFEVRAMSFDRATRPEVVDEEVNYRIFALESALEPGDALHLAFDVAYRPRGFPNDGIPTEVVRNGAYLNRAWLPFVGYQPIFELSDDEARQRFGLAPRPPLPGPDDAAARSRRFAVRNEELVDAEAVIGTAADQTAITIGVLQRSWTENGRRYFHYETEAPAPFGTIVSAQYEVLEDRWNDVALQVFHHPSHDFNLDRMMRGLKASLEYFTTEFGPYPDSQLRIVEIPRYGGFGHAHPHTIAFTEDAFLSRVREGEVDQPFFGTAHEVAHQWWGGRVRGAAVRGAGFLSESLANYSAMMVTEKTYGPEMARRVYDFQKERYLFGRARQSREVPVLEVEDQPYLMYRKGAIALYTLRERIGEEAVNGALRRYFEKFHAAGPPYPTSLDLYAELRAVTPDSLQSLLSDLFETITLWDVRAERAVVEPTGDGQHAVTLTVVAKKMRVDGEGNETEVPMDELVEIGVFAPGESDALGDPLYLKPHRIQSGEQTIRVTVPREPARAGIDPYRKMIERQGDDNVVGVEADPSGGDGPSLGRR